MFLRSPAAVPVHTRCRQKIGCKQGWNFGKQIKGKARERQGNAYDACPRNLNRVRREAGTSGVKDSEQVVGPGDGRIQRDRRISGPGL